MTVIGSSRISRGISAARRYALSVYLSTGLIFRGQPLDFHISADSGGHMTGSGAETQEILRNLMNIHVASPDRDAPPEACPALVLNADYRPLSYFPLSLWSWQDAIKAVFLDRVNIVSEYDSFVHSPSFEMRIPSVVSLKSYVKPAIHPAFTRFNLFLRDRFECQYCHSPKDLTFDHVIPRSKGGETSWENVVAACAPCNLRKGGRMPKQAAMFPHQKAYRPTVQDLHKNGRLFPPNYLHDSWMDFLYWDSPLEP